MKLALIGLLSLMLIGCTTVVEKPVLVKFEPPEVLMRPPQELITIKPEVVDEKPE